MGTVIRLKSTLSRDRVQKDLHSGFPDDNIKITIFCSILAPVSHGIAVLIKLKPKQVTIYATTPILSELLSDISSAFGVHVISFIYDRKKNRNMLNGSQTNITTSSHHSRALQLIFSYPRCSHIP